MCTVRAGMVSRATGTGGSTPPGGQYVVTPAVLLGRDQGLQGRCYPTKSSLQNES
jgi:hypothetical protein